MKLYTEESIKAIGQWAAQWDLYELDKEINSKPPIFKEFIESLTPIELPSDEEIKKFIGSNTHKYYAAGFDEGAKWVKEQLLKNK